MRAIAVLSLVLFLALTGAAHATTLAEGLSVQQRDAVAARRYGYPAPALYCFACDLLNVRNIQGGIHDPARPSMRNLDIGAGTPRYPGVLELGADVSRAVVIRVLGRPLFKVTRRGVFIFRAGRWRTVKVSWR